MTTTTSTIQSDLSAQDNIQYLIADLSAGYWEYHVESDKVYLSKGLNKILKGSNMEEYIDLAEAFAFLDKPSLIKLQTEINHLIFKYKSNMSLFLTGVTKSGEKIHLKFTARIIGGVSKLSGLIQRIAPFSHPSHNDIKQAVDKERGDIGRKIHDYLGSYLTAAHMHLQALIHESSLFGMGRANYSNKLHSANTFVENAIHESRLLIEDACTSSQHADKSLVAQLQKLIDGVQDFFDTGVVFYHNLSSSFVLPQAVAHELYRITQEAVNNTLKHANASTLSVQLVQYEDCLMLMVEDDGKGFDKEQSFQAGHGLKNIQDRTKAVYGNCQVETLAGKGTLISIEVPL